MSTPAHGSRATPKSTRKSLVVILDLPSHALAQFASPSVTPPAPKRTASTSINDAASPSIQHHNASDKTPESNATPVPLPANDATDSNNNSLAPPKAGNTKKKGSTAVPGRKRAPPSIDPNAPPRERGRPGPKKKPRLPDGTIDRTGEKSGAAATAAGGANTIPAHKLGPKANTGAINAGLRALDRTGKPCRKWAKRGLQLKSFTGTAWNMPSWKAPPRDDSFAGDVKSDSTGSSEVKGVNASSAVPSERSHSHVDGGDTTMVNGIESSPAPPIAT